MPLTRSRYDGYAEWYDGWSQPHAEHNAPQGSPFSRSSHKILGWTDCENRNISRSEFVGSAQVETPYAPNVLDLLGPGKGLCLDLGCGCGHYFDALASTGRTVIGLDRSADQLRIARGRCRRIVQGDGRVR